jgi:N-hydroxyarylamine O-acetyltransferase
VRVEGQPWIADVGFGDSFLEPLALDGKEHSSGGMLYFVDRWPEGLILLRQEDGLWSAKYVFTLQPRRLEEFAAMCVYHQTSPNSTFPRARICSRATPQGRVTLSEMRLIESANGERTERMLESEEQYAQALAEHFGIELPNPDWKPLRQG